MRPNMDDPGKHRPVPDDTTTYKTAPKLPAQNSNDTFEPVRRLLDSNGLGEYIDMFLAQQVDMDSFVLLDRTDLQEMKIPYASSHCLGVSIISLLILCIAWVHAKKCCI